MEVIPSQIFYCFQVLWHLAFYLHIKFRPDISIHGKVITTSGCWRQTSAIFKFHSRFRRTLHRYRHFVFLHWPTKFYANRMIADVVMMSYWFYNMAAVASQIYFRLPIWPRVTFRKIRSYLPNKVRPDISIHGRDYYYFRFLKTNGRHLEILLPVSILTFSLPSAGDSALAYKLLCKSDDRRRSYDVIVILQCGGHSVANLLPVSDLATPEIQEGPELSSYQISTRYLNPRPRYYYLRFLKTNGRHLEILVPVSILTFSLPSACDYALATKFYANRMIADGVMTSY